MPLNAVFGRRRRIEASRLMRRLRLASGIVVVTLALSLAAIELAYRITLSGLEPLPTLPRPGALPARVAAAIWASQGVADRDPVIPRLYPWSIHRYFQNEAGLNLAWVVARDFLWRARERGQVRGNLGWHLKGMIVTVWVTRQLSTDEIVADYADLIPFGEVGQGLGVGARHFLGKDVAALNEGDLALLLAVARSPNAYDPIRHPDRALVQRNTMLERFVRSGFMRADALAAARSAPLQVRSPAP